MCEDRRGARAGAVSDEDVVGAEGGRELEVNVAGEAMRRNVDAVEDDVGYGCGNGEDDRYDAEKNGLDCMAVDSGRCKDTDWGEEEVLVVGE